MIEHDTFVITCPRLNEEAEVKIFYRVFTNRNDIAPTNNHSGHTCSLFGKCQYTADPVPICISKSHLR